MLIGAYVPNWSEHKISADVSHEEFDHYIVDLAQQVDIDTSKPFPFIIDGDLADVRMHVINGACPMHARLKKIEILRDKRPFESNFARVQGKVVGIFARDAVGNITHPATMTHAHLLFRDSDCFHLAGPGESCCAGQTHTI